VRGDRRELVERRALCTKKRKPWGVLYAMLYCHPSHPASFPGAGQPYRMNRYHPTRDRGPSPAVHHPGHQHPTPNPHQASHSHTTITPPARCRHAAARSTTSPCLRGKRFDLWQASKWRGMRTAGSSKREPYQARHGPPEPGTVRARCQRAVPQVGSAVWLNRTTPMCMPHAASCNSVIRAMLFSES
jgi:hypothetical protein